MSVGNFRTTAQDGDARAGEFTLPGINSPFRVETPCFMPVGTQGTVKGMRVDDLQAIGAQIILGNTYHLYLRPGHERVERLGGLHQMTGWSGPILTDSGGFQVFSLGGLNKISDDGVEFRSHIDGSRHFLDARKSMEIQRALGADIVMAFDQCPPFSATKDEVKQAMDRTARWAKEGLAFELKKHQWRFGIVQGGLHVDLRHESLEEIGSMPFDGVALGGLSIGEPPEMMHEMVGEIGSKMPVDRPRYLMGVGRPQDLVEAVKSGIDLFDCVMPTRNARNGQLFTSQGKLNIKNAEHADDQRPVDPNCNCAVCHKYTRAYLRHLFVAGEMLGLILNTHHNLACYLNLMKQMRSAIVENRFDEWTKNFYISWDVQKP